MARLADLAFRHRVLLFVLMVHTVLWGFADIFISPHADFVDHWVQSRFLSWGYYEHPPMIAVLIRGLSFIFGESESGLEAMAIVVNLAILLATYALAVRTFGVRAAVFTLLCLEATLYYAAGTPILQIDQPLQLAWLGALWSLLEYQRSGRQAWLLAAGAFAGLGALSKYTMVLFYLAGLVYVLWVPARRREMRNPWLYASGLLALAIFAPVIVWNAQHDWFSFRFQLEKGGGSDVLPGKHLLEFTLGYLLLFSPVLIGWGAPRLWGRLRAGGRADSPLVLLSIMGLVPIAFFSLALVRGSFPDPKWANVGFLSFYLLLGQELDRLWSAGEGARVRRWLASALAVNALLIGIAAAHTWRPFLPIGPAGDPTQQIVGWREVGQQITNVLRERGSPLPEYVVSYTYPLSSQLAFHLPWHPWPWNLQRHVRNLWIDRTRMSPDNTLIVCQDRECNWLARRLKDQFRWTAEPIGRVHVFAAGRLRHRVDLYRPISLP